MPTNIAFIGAGSAVFARTLLCDILSFEALRDSTHFRLMDIDADRLDLIHKLARRVIDQEGLKSRVSKTQNLNTALKNADFVVIMFQIGGLEAFRHDVMIPRKYGIDQTVGDTLGPGGVFRALRSIPVYLDVCRRMQRLCPDALMLNYANPMAMNCWAINAAGVRNVGLCHSVQGTAGQLAGIIGVPFDELTYWVAGINHMSWFLRLEHKGRDLYPVLRQRMEDPEIYRRESVRFEIMKHFGYFVTESTHHMSEYCPYFRRRKGMTKSYIPKRWDYYDICAGKWRPHYKHLRRQVEGREPIHVRRSHEYGASIINSVVSNQPCRINGSVANEGIIGNLPPGCVVEVPCLVDNTGVNPCRVGDLPPQLAALNRTNINVQECAVQAALNGDAEMVHRAVMLDPLTASLLELKDIRRMVDEMLKAEAQWLPQFKT